MEKQTINSGEGNYLLQTEKNIFVFIRINELGLEVSIPGGTISKKAFEEIVGKALQAKYRFTKPSDYNYLWDERNQKVAPNYELFKKQEYLTLISKKPLMSDRTNKPGRVEIKITDCGSLSMKTLSIAGERIDYHLSKFEKSLTVRTENDIYFDKNNDLHRFYNIRAYSVVQNKEEFERLIPCFWQIIRMIIGDDKIIAVTRRMDEEESTLKEIMEKYEVKEVMSRKCYIFKDGYPQISDFDDGGPEHFFEVGQNEIVLITTIGISSLIYYKTTLYKEGVIIEDTLQEIQKKA